MRGRIQQQLDSGVGSSTPSIGKELEKFEEAGYVFVFCLMQFLLHTNTSFANLHFKLNLKLSFQLAGGFVVVLLKLNRLVYKLNLCSQKQAPLSSVELTPR